MLIIIIIAKKMEQLHPQNKYVLVQARYPYSNQ